ncbi:hypothetical protein [Hyphomicrobium sp. CS1GBMeth3]|uniref:hypothetical protein n=1 Tax=Hyphomicrobium sp. CS1GBMeth3 TaxID=1892845 RepID=UPI0009317991|nr:hypothetical protein [Hyphomicrobium sp. CS1GBMeth3]
MQEDSSNSRTGPGSLELETEPVPAIPPPSPLAEPGRHRYAVGVFAVPSKVAAAVVALSAQGCDVLVVFDPARAGPMLAPAHNGRLTFHHIDSSAALAGGIIAMLADQTPFVALGSSLQAAPGEVRSGPGIQRLFDKLGHHLERGAVVVIVHAPDAERQLLASRGLLEAQCDILLTHDVLLPGELGLGATATLRPATPS